MGNTGKHAIEGINVKYWKYMQLSAINVGNTCTLHASQHISMKTPPGQSQAMSMFAFDQKKVLVDFRNVSWCRLAPLNSVHARFQKQPIVFHPSKTETHTYLFFNMIDIGCSRNNVNT